MNESQRIEIFNRKLYLIGENSIKQYEREQGRLEAEAKYKDEIAELKAKLAQYEKALKSGELL